MFFLDFIATNFRVRTTNMRWILVDRFEVLEKGKYAKGIRAVTRAEESILDRYPCFPVMPGALLIEMMAQVGGVLVGASIDFQKEVVLAKVSEAIFDKPVCPPNLLTIEADLLDVGEDAASTKCRVSSGGSEVASCEIFFGLFAGLGDEGKRSLVFSKDFMESFALNELINKAGSR